MDAQFPARTAGELTLPNGVKVWVQTLSAPLRDEADRHAARYAQAEMRDCLKGGEGYLQMVAELSAMTPDEQADLLLRRELLTIETEAEAEHPEPVEPKREEEAEQDAYDQACEEWRTAREAATAARLEMVKKRRAEERQKLLALSEADRVEACRSFSYRLAYFNILFSRQEVETILRAVRKVEDHRERYFKSLADVIDLDDLTRNAMMAFYREIDPINAGE